MNSDDVRYRRPQFSMSLGATPALRYPALASDVVEIVFGTTGFVRCIIGPAEAITR